MMVAKWGFPELANIRLSTIEVAFNSTHVAPKMTRDDWDEVNSHIEQIREVGRRVGYRVPVYTDYKTVHLADYVEDNLIGRDYRLICTGQIVYAGMVCKWTIDRERKVTCERCLKKLGKEVS